jgi:hypothetical protein
MSLQAESIYLVNRIRRGKRGRRQVAVGVPDRALTPNAGLAAVTGPCDWLGVIGAVEPHRRSSAGLRSRG